MHLNSKYNISTILLEFIRKTCAKLRAGLEGAYRGERPWATPRPGREHCLGTLTEVTAGETSDGGG